MHTVLSALEKEPVGIAHLRRSSPAWVRVMEYDGLPPNGSIQQVFGKKYKAVIVLYQMHDSKHRQQDGMGHYACLIKLKNGVEYFSSYGGTPASEIGQTHSDPKKLQRLLGRDYIVNRAKLQAKYHTATCGRWAFARALLADLPLKSFQKYFSQKISLPKPDQVVALATIFAIR